MFIQSLRDRAYVLGIAGAICLDARDDLSFGILNGRTPIYIGCSPNDLTSICAVDDYAKGASARVFRRRRQPTFAERLGHCFDSNLFLLGLVNLLHSLFPSVSQYAALALTTR